MKFKNIAVTILIAIACMTVAVWAKTGQSTPKVQQWEYMASHTSPKQSVGEAVPEFDELGKQGWELVNVTYEGWAYFKRPKN